MKKKNSLVKGGRDEGDVLRELNIKAHGTEVHLKYILIALGGLSIWLLFLTRALAKIAFKNQIDLSSLFF